MQALADRMNLIDAAIPRTGIVGDIVLILCFSMFTAAMAQLSIWIGPVPITGQTLAVLMTGAVLGSRRGALSMITYLALGAAGMPFWFASGIPVGFARLIGPTGGYLFGFVFMAYIVGLLSERGWDRNIIKASVSMIAGSAVMYACGLFWLAGFVPEGKVLELGLYPFILGDALKIALAGLSLPAGWRLLKFFRQRN
jgi:biotin transport system substrate-specific component